MIDKKGITKTIIISLIFPILVGLSGGWILNYYKNKNDTEKVVAQLNIEIKRNLPVLKQYLTDVESYTKENHAPQDIYKLQSRIFYTNAYQSIRHNLSLLDDNVMADVLMLYHNYEQVQILLPYNQMPEQDKTIGNHGWQRIGGPEVMGYSKERTKEILDKKIVMLAQSIKISEDILKAIEKR